MLDTSTNTAGQAFDVPQPSQSTIAKRAQEQYSQPATSYVNFYLVNGAVIVPQFGEYRTDEAAVQTLKELFPDRVIETVIMNWMSWAGGGPHSATLQWPKAAGC